MTETTDTRTPELADLARHFHSLHQDATPLVLPNAWDALSARLVVRAGATAVATTSSGTAWSMGVPDGERLDRRQALELIARIAAAVPVPVTADIESGLARDAAGVGETVRGVLEAGAVGGHLEDADHGGPEPPRAAADPARRLEAARAAGDALGVPVFVNARVDVFLRGVGDRTADRMRRTLERAEAHLAAGADGLFVPGVTDAELIAELAAALPVPLNVLAGPGAPPVPALAAAGAARVSVGSALARSAYALAERAAREILTAGTFEGLAGGHEYSDLDALDALMAAPRDPRAGETPAS
ncbi:isocitrate lyase/PEP mutase family protein [Streptomyces specialis]|uniref:isocitrate lyase/PEP mutase family protein n=1 Tax=Streptomyces specialis TaxID=498367 RepID=UPI00073F1E5C|nr:isocitrate lyase/phosphoenolpyruvate mutase family protein [Streptomyces specialis]